MGEFKRQNVSEEHKAGDAEDRISSLSEDVLQHILSFLETKDAVLTGILSRRWRYLWTCIPIVDFDDKPLYSNQSKFWLTIEDLPLFGPIGDTNGCEIKINAAKLSSFKYCGYLNNDIQLSNLLISVKASLHIPIAYQLQDKIAPRAVNLFQKVKNAYSLRISNCTIESLFQADVLDHLPMFQQLNHLELTMKVKEHNVGSLIKFLKHLPNLESLYFAKVFDPLLSLREDGWTWESVPNCLLSSLKTVDLLNFYGNASEICLLKTLLICAPCLERINLFSLNSPSTKLKEWGDLRNQLEKFPRGSKHCVITIF